MNPLKEEITRNKLTAITQSTWKSPPLRLLLGKDWQQPEFVVLFEEQPTIFCNGQSRRSTEPAINTFRKAVL